MNSRRRSLSDRSASGRDRLECVVQRNGGRTEHIIKFNIIVTFVYSIFHQLGLTGRKFLLIILLIAVF